MTLRELRQLLRGIDQDKQVLIETTAGKTFHVESVRESWAQDMAGPGIVVILCE